MVSSFKKYSPKYPLGTFLNETPEFISKEPTKLPSGYFLNKRSEFFQKVPINLIKMYLAGSFQSTHNELSIWSSFTTNSQRTCQVYGWVHFDQIDGYFLKEL